MELTVLYGLPRLSFIFEDLNRWLTPLYAKVFYLWYDEEMISTLEPRRKEKAYRINAATYMKVNEKRQAMGLDNVPGGDVILVSKATCRSIGQEILTICLRRAVLSTRLTQTHCPRQQETFRKPFLTARR
jgi:hypothetical protein